MGWSDEGMEIERNGGMNGKMEVWSNRVMEEGSDGETEGEME